MYSRIKLTICFIAMSLLAFQCDKLKECKDVVCTTEIKTIGIKVTDLSMQPTGFTVKVLNTEHNHYIHTNSVKVNDDYLLVSDENSSHFGTINQTQLWKMEFYRNSTLIKSVDYKVGKDCCHVFLESGPLEVTLP